MGKVKVRDECVGDIIIFNFIVFICICVFVIGVICKSLFLKFKGLSFLVGGGIVLFGAFSIIGNVDVKYIYGIYYIVVVGIVWLYFLGC